MIAILFSFFPEDFERKKKNKSPQKGSDCKTINTDPATVKFQQHNRRRINGQS